MLREYVTRSLLIAATALSVAVPTTMPAPAFAAAERNWRDHRHYDYNSVERGQRRYYADRYYRSGRYYQDRRLTRADRIYRGSNGRHYCRRGDGTTGLIIGAGLGALIGSQLSFGRFSTISALIGGAAGAALSPAAIFAATKL
jgi:Glycine zipper 2TM domain